MTHRITLSGFLITLGGAIFFSTKAIFVKLAFHSTRVDALTLVIAGVLLIGRQSAISKEPVAVSKEITVD